MFSYLKITGFRLGVSTLGASSFIEYQMLSLIVMSIDILVEKWSKCNLSVPSAK